MNSDAPIDRLLTAEEIARRITASSGVIVTPRTIWEKAKRVGVSKKIGRSMLIDAADIPKLLGVEKSKSERVEDQEGDRFLAEYLRGEKKRKIARAKAKRLRDLQRAPKRSD